jgi:hypothetical protein
MADIVDRHCCAIHDLAPFKGPMRILFIDAPPIDPGSKVLKRGPIARHSVAAA